MGQNCLSSVMGHQYQHFNADELNSYNSDLQGGKSLDLDPPALALAIPKIYSTYCSTCPPGTACAVLICIVLPVLQVQPALS